MSNISVSPEQAKRIYRELLRNNLPSFIEKTFATVSPHATYAHNWHIDAICDYLEACRRGEIKRLIINMPPRFLKSICVSIGFSAWLLGHDPSMQIMCASYAQALATAQSLDTRLIMQSEWYNNLFPDTMIAKDQNEKAKFQTTERGHRIATSVGGSVTGLGADLLILDDPIKPDEALSDTVANSTNNWIDQAFISRANNPKDPRMIVVMQRLNENDPVGHLLERGGWETLILPVQFEKKVFIDAPTKCYELQKDELLHPEYCDYATTQRLLRDLGEYAFASQYMQRPAPLEGGMIKRSWFKLYDDDSKPANFDSIVHSWDTAVNDKESNDFSACTIWGCAKNGYYLLGLVNKRMQYPDLKQEILRLYNRDKPHYVLMENRSSGQPVGQEIKRNSMIPIHMVEPFTSKIGRVNSVAMTSLLIHQGMIYIPSDKMWVDEVLSQLTLFPNAKHDDVVDSFTQFVNWADKHKAMLLKNDVYDDNDFDLVGY